MNPGILYRKFIYRIYLLEFANTSFGDGMSDIQQYEKKLEENTPDEEFSPVLEDNLSKIQLEFEGNDTLVIKKMQNRLNIAQEFCIVYLEYMVDEDKINEYVIKQLLNGDVATKGEESWHVELLAQQASAPGKITCQKKLRPSVEAILGGMTLVLLQGSSMVLLVETTGGEQRKIMEPETPKVLRGPRAGFTENISTNISLLGRIIRSPKLQLRYLQLGELTSTRVCVCWIKGLVLEDILAELMKRLGEIKIDAILDSGYVQELIRDEPFSPFETVGSYERPDIVASKILEGRIAVIVDGSPFVLTVPYILAEAFQANSDYYVNYLFGTFNRILRILAFVFSSTLPAIFVALTTFHQEMLPTDLLISFSAALKGVPFPTGLSMFIMLMLFDFLQEAGARIPASIGQTVSIVGTLVLGQAAVEAKLVSAPVIIVTALTGILTVINFALLGPAILIRMGLLILSSILGIFGCIFGVVFLLLHLLSLRSFGIPYVLGFTSLRNHSGQDIWFRAPWWSMTLRPKIIAAKNQRRQPPKAKSRQGG